MIENVHIPTVHTMKQNLTADKYFRKGNCASEFSKGCNANLSFIKKCQYNFFMNNILSNSLV